MSTQGALTFHERLLTDEDFQNRALEAAEGKTGMEATEALVQFGRADGLELTASELIDVQSAMSDADELSEERLATVAGGGGTLANIDLQNMLQKQQQSLQTMSNVSKMLHDTAMAVIRKIG